MNDPREEALREDARRNLRRNYGVHVVHGLLGQTGFRLIHVPTFIPVYLFELSGSNLVVGLARALQAFGMFLSPVFSATLIEHRRRVLPLGFLVGGLMRVQVLGIALAGFFLAPRHNLVAVCVFLGLFGFFLGMQSVIFHYLVSKVIPVERRGILEGLRNALAGVVSAGVGGLGGWFVDRGTLGNGYATTFLLAFGLTAAGLLVLTAMREPESHAVRAQSNVRDRLADLPALLRSDRSFTRYFLARALGNMGRMAVPFYILLARERIGLSGEQLGQLTAAFVLAQSILNLGWGWVADRTGFRRTFLVALGVWMGAAGILLGADSFEAFLAGFVGLGTGLGGFQLSAQNLVLEFGSRENLPMRIAVANSASELLNAVGPLLGGLLATLFSYPVVIATAIGVQAVSFGIATFWVDEPRHRTAPRA